MKKLLIFMMVLGITSMANAALQISVNGNKFPSDGELFLGFGEEFILGIWTDTEISAGYDTVFALVVDTGYPLDASISGGCAVEPYASQADLSLLIFDDALSNGVPIPSGTNGVWGGVASIGGSIPAYETIFDGIILHNEAEPLELWVFLGEISASSTFIPVDSVMIFGPVPEPTTLLLLGLGGLALLRKHKK